MPGVSEEQQLPRALDEAAPLQNVFIAGESKAACAVATLPYMGSRRLIMSCARLAGFYLGPQRLRCHDLPDIIPPT